MTGPRSAARPARHPDARAAGRRPCSRSAAVPYDLGIVSQHPDELVDIEEASQVGRDIGVVVLSHGRLEVRNRLEPLDRHTVEVRGTEVILRLARTVVLLVADGMLTAL